MRRIVVGWMWAALVAGGAPVAAAEPPAGDAGQAGAFKVEYVEVEGAGCLQPLRRSADAALEDFQEAERRYIAARHPGATIETWQTVITLGPESELEPGVEVATTERDTFEVELADGQLLKVCFAVGLTERKEKSAN